LGKNYYVHTLVAKTWLYKELINKAIEIKETIIECKNMTIDEIVNSYQTTYSIVCDHINRNPKDNYIENLRWVTMKENSENQIRIKKVQQYSLDGTFIEEFASIIRASKKTTVNAKLISFACNGKIKSAKDYIWKFKSNDNFVEEVD